MKAIVSLGERGWGGGIELLKKKLLTVHIYHTRKSWENTSILYLAEILQKSAVLSMSCRVSVSTQDPIKPTDYCLFPTLKKTKTNKPNKTNTQKIDRHAAIH